ncbi:MAG: hypothetical protein U1C33_00660, partial [Candidatus Cloacimonadaceae bacterium]|nr:hypothetical protein [Candidatus Cloacimonadaceae bacterium]
MRNGIFGRTVVVAGALHLNQDSAQRSDLNGEIMMSGGLMTVSGGSSTSIWSANANTRIQMSAGTLDFRTSSINIVNSDFAFVESITGGTIRTVGNFICQRSNFRPTVGFVELYGPGVAYVSIHPQSFLQGLAVNKSGRGEAGTSDERDEPNVRTNQVYLISPLHLRNALLVSSGVFDLNNNALRVDGPMGVHGTLLMNSPSDNLYVKRAITFHEGSIGQITHGTVEAGNWFIIEEDANFQMAANTTLRFWGLGSGANTFNYAKIDNYATGTRFGNLVVDKPDLANLIIQSPTPLIVQGNFNIQNQSNVEFNHCDMTITGSLTLNNGSKLAILDYSTLNVNGATSISDELIVGSYSELICNSTFSLPSQGSMKIYDESIVKLARAYAGVYFSFTGNVTLYEDAILEITHNGLQIGTAANIQVNTGTIKIGWAFRAMSPNTFNGGAGQVELFGARSGQIEMHSTNSFYDLVINKPGISYAVMQVSQVVANRDIIIQGGNLTPLNNILRTLRDLRIEGGRLTLATGSVMQVCRNWINTAGTAAFD